MGLEIEMTINVETLRGLMKSAGLNQRTLAARARISEKTVSRLLNTGTQPRANSVTRIAKALRVEPEDLMTPPSGLESEREGRLPYRAAIDSDNYNFVEARYGVPVDALIDMAPLLFTVLAEMILAERREDLKRFEAELERAFGALPLSLTGLDYDCIDEGRDKIASAIAREKAAIEARDLAFYGDVNDEGEQPFTEYIGNILERLGLKVLLCGAIAGYFPWIDYSFVDDEVSAITGDDKWAKEALRQRYVTIGDIPQELHGEERADERSAWLASKVSPDARAEVLAEIEAEIARSVAKIEEREAARLDEGEGGQ